MHRWFVGRAKRRVAFDSAVLTKDFESAWDFVKSGVHFDGECSGHDSFVNEYFSDV